MAHYVLHRSAERGIGLSCHPRRTPLWTAYLGRAGNPICDWIRCCQTCVRAWCRAWCVVAECVESRRHSPLKARPDGISDPEEAATSKRKAGVGHPFTT
jgi:hypothetical protein